MNKFIIYARKSSEADDKQVQSIDDQLNYCKKRLESLEGKYISTFMEEKSAKKPWIRSAFYEMLELIEKTDGVSIVCWKLDRLSRNPVDSGTIQYALQTGKITSIITSDRVYQKEDAGLMFSVETGMGNQFIIDLSKNTKRGMQWKADRGGLGWPAPHGYLNDILNKSVIIDEDRFSLVRRMWDLLIKDGYSLSRIADIANNEWWFRTVLKKRRWGKPIGSSSLYNIFTNPFYAGMIRFKGKMMPWAHPAMVTLEEYQEAQKILGKNLTAERPSVTEFSFTGWIHCACCGCKVTAENKVKTTKTGKQHSYIYYHCTHKKDTKEKKCTQRKNINEKELDAQIIDILSAIEIYPNFVDWAKGVLHRLHGDEAKKQEEILHSLNNRIADGKRKLSNLLSYLMNETISEDEYKAEKAKTEKEVETLEIKRLAMNRGSTNWITVMENTLDFVQTARTKFLLGDIQAKKTIFRALGSNLSMMDGKLSLELNSWFQPFTKMKASPESALSRLEPRKKSISMRNTNAFDDWFTVWLPILEEVRDNILKYEGLINIPHI